MPRNIDREGPIQRSIVQYLHRQYPSALIFSVPNELASKVGGGMSGKKQQDRIRNVQFAAKKMGMLPGMADVCLLYQGRFYAFEVKAEGNKQQPNQEAVEALCDANGGRYYVVRSIDDVKEALGPVHPVSEVPLVGVAYPDKVVWD